GHRNLNPNGRGRQRERQVVGQRRDPAYLDLNFLGRAVRQPALDVTRLQRELRYGRTLLAVHHARWDAETAQRVFDNPSALVHQRVVNLHLGACPKDVQRRQPLVAAQALGRRHLRRGDLRYDRLGGLVSWRRGFPALRLYGGGFGRRRALRLERWQAIAQPGAERHQIKLEQPD